MSQRVVLHVGTMKTGTSYLQSVLGAERERLLADGDEFLLGFGEQTRAVLDVLRLPTAPQRHTRRWAEVAQRAHAARAGAAVVSMEFLSYAEPHHVRALLEPLRGLEVRVLLTVRDQQRVLPAQWQSFVRNFGADDWPTYLRRVERGARDAQGGGRAHRKFSRAQDVERIVERWSVPGVAGIDVVTVPPPDAPRELLWHRFCEAAGLRASAVDEAAVADNESIGYAACDWLRRANPGLSAGVSKQVYRRVSRPVVRRVLVPLRAEQERPRLDRAGAAFAGERNLALRTLLDSDRVRLVGDLADLPVPSDADLAALPEAPAPPDPEQLLVTARAVHRHALQRHRRRAGAPEAGDPLVQVDRDDVDALVAAAVGLLRGADGAATPDD